MKTLKRNEELVMYFVERCSGRVGRVRLMKYLYLADLEGRRYLGKPLSSFKYRLDKHGPFDPEIYHVLDSLTKAGLIFPDQYPWQGNVSFAYHAAHEAVAFSLSPAERHILEFIIREFHQLEMVHLLEDIVYETGPMKKAKFGEMLDMDSVNNERKNELRGIDLERIMRAEQQLKEGKWTLLDQVLKELEGARPGGSETKAS